jgi:hypothetical protein
MAAWPGVPELAQRLNTGDDGAEHWADALDGILASAISRVKRDVGAWDDTTDEPDDALAEAAIRMAELIWQREVANTGGTTAGAGATLLGLDPTYQRLLYGHRRTFGVA